MDKIKILVVDDESRMRKLVKDFLGREGYQVLEAGDGMEAMEVFYDAKNGRLAGMPRSAPVIQSSDYHADCKIRRERRITGI